MDVEKCVSAPVASARNGDIPPVRVTGPTLRKNMEMEMLALDNKDLTLFVFLGYHH